MDIRTFHPDKGTSIDVIIGGPPCQAYSLAGRGKISSLKGFKKAHLNDYRGSLYLEFVRVVEEAKPTAVVMENVPEIMSYGNVDVPEKICNLLSNQGYNCKFTILNAAEYGVPQYRERFFLIGIKQGLGEPIFPEPTHSIPDDKKSGRIRISNYIGKSGSSFAVQAPISSSQNSLPVCINTFEALDDLPYLSTFNGGSWKCSNTVRMDYKSDPHSAYAKLMRNWPGLPVSEYSTANASRNTPRDFPIFARMKEGDKYPEANEIAMDIFNEKIESYTELAGKKPSGELLEKIRSETVPPYSTEKFPDKWRKLDKNQPSHTVVAHLGVDTYSHIHYDSTIARGVTVREAARLQSFPDSYKLPASLSDAYKQIGNAVPPLLAYHLAMALKKSLK